MFRFDCTFSNFNCTKRVQLHTILRPASKEMGREGRGREERGREGKGHESPPPLFGGSLRL